MVRERTREAPSEESFAEREEQGKFDGMFKRWGVAEKRGCLGTNKAVRIDIVCLGCEKLKFKTRPWCGCG